MLKINQVVWFSFSGNFGNGNDDLGYYCMPQEYYAYMPVRICSFAQHSAGYGGDHVGNLACASITWDLTNLPPMGAHGGNWNVPISHFTEQYNAKTFMQTLLLTPGSRWPKKYQFAYIEDIRQNFAWHNRHVVGSDGLGS